MSSLPTCNRLTLFVFLLLLGGSLHAQLARGFRLLSTNQAQSAKEAFEPLLEHPEHQAPAHYGLALATQKSMSSMHDLITAHALMERAIELGKEVSAAQRNQWIKRRWFASNPMPSFYQKLLSQAYRKYRQANHLPQIDSLQAFIHRTNKRQSAKSKIDSLQQRLLPTYVKNADSYEQLSYLINRHPEVLQRSSGQSLDTLHQRVLARYLEHHRREGMDRFRRENPTHPVLGDPSLDPFSRSMVDGGLAAMLQFCMDYPQSTFTELALADVASSQQDNKGLSPEQQRVRDAINNYSSSNRYNMRGTPPVPSSEDIEQFRQHITMFAPHGLGINVLHKAMRGLIYHRQWDDALQLATTARDLYLHCAGCPSPSPYQAWFDNLMPLLEQPTEGILPKPLEVLNTRRGGEVFPFIATDGQSLYFVGVGRTDNLEGEDTFVSTRSRDGQWSAPSLVPKLSGSGNTACNAITNDGREMLVFHNGELCLSQKTATGWSSPKVISSISKYFEWVGRTCYADNGRVILLEARTSLSSDINIYASRRDSSGEWQKPFPLGVAINTRGHDRSPFMHADNRSLYFSSDGHGGLGGLDVFMSTRLDDSWTNWSKPVNVGKELNTIDDDLGFTITASGKEIYLSSKPAASPALSYDLYVAQLPSFVQPQPQQIISMKIRQSPGVSIPVVATDANGNPIADGFTLPDGTLNISLPADALHPITFSSASEQNIFVPVVLGATDTVQDIVRYESTVDVFSIQELLSGERSLKTRGIFFASDADTLAIEALAELRAIYQLLHDKNLSIEVAGFADPDGSEAYNLQLSRRRANRVRAQLITWGYPDDKVVAVGYGVRSASGAALSEEEKADCRRVEVRVKS